MPESKVAAVMTAGRFENTWARNQIERAVKKLGIPLTISGGVYYGQCMQKMFETLVKTECQLIITIDWDSIFTADQLQRLIDIAAQEIEIDALAALQIRRGRLDMLGTIEGQREAHWTGYPLRVSTAHFGLTIISVEALRRTTKPWFHAQPDANGEWGEDKIDDDVFFWKQWEAAGNNIYIDPGCRIGHLEEMIAIYDAELKPQHIYPADWEEQHNDRETVETVEAVHAGQSLCD